VLFSFAVLLSHGCSLGMTLDEFYLLLLVCNYRSSTYILYSSFRGISYAVGTTALQISEGLLTVGPDVARFLVVVVALCKASLSSVVFYHDNYMVKAIQLEYLLRFCLSY
jgi:hypothetical protein